MSNLVLWGSMRATLLFSYPFPIDSCRLQSSKLHELNWSCIFRKFKRNTNFNMPATYSKSSNTVAIAPLTNPRALSRLRVNRTRISFLAIIRKFDLDVGSQRYPVFSCSSVMPCARKLVNFESVLNNCGLLVRASLNARCCHGRPHIPSDVLADW